MIISSKPFIPPFGKVFEKPFGPQGVQATTEVTGSLLITPGTDKILITGTADNIAVTVLT